MFFQTIITFYVFLEWKTKKLEHSENVFIFIEEKLGLSVNYCTLQQWGCFAGKTIFFYNNGYSSPFKRHKTTKWTEAKCVTSDDIRNKIYY